MSFGRSLAAPFTVNLFPCDEGGFNRRKVNLRAINLRLDPSDEGAGQLDISSRVPDLYQRLTLPVVGSFGIIPQRVGKADREFALVALRPQAKVYSEYRAFGRMPGEDFRNLLRQTDKIFTIGYRRRGRLGTIAIEIEEVNIGTVIEFIASEFSQ